jgi:hypothetical protein
MYYVKGFEFLGQAQEKINQTRKKGDKKNSMRTKKKYELWIKKSNELMN